MATRTSARAIPLVEPWLDALCAQAVHDQVLASFIGPGAACKALSSQLSALAGVPHCLLTTSGTIALSVSALALDLAPGDEILVPAYGVISTINAFASIGLRPRLVDLDPRTGCVSPATLESRITPRTKAVCYVNFAGSTGADLVAVAELCARRQLPLIEDAAQAIGHRHGNRAAGSFGTIGTLSFSVPKTITTGQGGAVFTSSGALFDTVAKHIDHGDMNWRQTNVNREIGTNLRFNDVLAALALAQLKTLEQRLSRKRDAYAVLRDELGELIFDVPGPEAPFYYIVFAEDPEAIVATLRGENIMAQRHGRALYEHPPYRDLCDGGFPGAAYWSDHAVYLPFGLALTTEDAGQIARAVGKLAGRLLKP